MRFVGDDIIIVAPKEHLPLVCAKTGQPTEHIVVHEVYDSPRWSWAMYAIWLWGFFAHLLASEHHSVQLPMAPDAARRARISNRVSGAIVVVCLLLSFLPPFGPLALPLVLLAVGLRWTWLHHTSIKVRARRGEFWLRGLHPNFVEACRVRVLRPTEVAG